ncbi:hypothetical protein SS50377_27837 [Spironucleus salmonicida]|uniref:Uncharacterized protein n=1 Tax=Spironucleus salmonicida TaxID=348837 RepID=A0A9P8LKP5_9EUKA|nr:hypothetical protein SS50377_27837 [Spironucleus salmonicida]
MKKIFKKPKEFNFIKTKQSYTGLLPSLDIYQKIPNNSYQVDANSLLQLFSNDQSVEDYKVLYRDLRLSSFLNINLNSANSQRVSISIK